MSQDRATFALSLICEPDGWKIYVIHGGPPSKKVAISTIQARSLARGFGDVCGPEVQPTPYEVAEAGTENMRQEAEGRLKEAEEAASKVPGLRKTLEEIGKG